MNEVLDRALEKLAAVPATYIKWDKAKYVPLNTNEYRVVGEKVLKDKIKRKGIKDVKNNVNTFINNAKKAKVKYDALPKDKKKILDNGLKLRAAKLGLKTGTKGAALYSAKELLVPNKIKRPRKDDKSRDNDKNTKFMRDIVKPELRKGVVKMPATIAATYGSVLGMGTGFLLNQVDALRKSKKGIKIDVNKHNKKMLAAAGIGSVLGAMPGTVASHAIDNRYRIKEYDRLKQRYLGEKITDKEKQKLKKPFFKKDKRALYHSMSPEELIQEERRRRDRKAAKLRKQQKQAYTILDEGLEKSALFGISKNFTASTSTVNDELPGGSLLKGTLSKYKAPKTKPAKNYAEILKPVEKVKALKPVKGVIGK